MKQEATYQKLRGGYYTPMPIAAFLAEWAIQTPKSSILEPGCGDGNFLEAAARVLLDMKVPKDTIPSQLLGIELDSDECRNALTRLKSLGISVSSKHVQVGDFFAHCRDLLKEQRSFDVVIGNPPFIRYQSFPEDQRKIAFGLMESAGLHPNRLTNAWVPFLVGSSLLLGEHGRLGMVVPSELLQVNYAAELRKYLSEYFSRLTLVTFKRLLFDDIQQEVVLFLAERNGSERKGIRTIHLSGMEDLMHYNHPDFSDRGLKPLDHSTEKWTLYFLTPDEISLIRRLRHDPRLTPLGDVAEVDVGIVTGLNEFFVLNQEKVKEHSLIDYTLPIVSRSPHLTGILFSEDDWNFNLNSNFPSYLLDSPNQPLDELPASLKGYISNGEAKKMNEGYKCRMRDPWYIVPSVWVPHAFMLRQVHNYPKIILNKTQAVCTDTIHRIRFKKGANSKAIATAFLNSLTFAFSEILGRSYGGGVLELEPREAESIPLPLKGADRLDVIRINELVLSNSIYSVLDMTDDLLLRKGLGLTLRETEMLRGIWEKLRDRRNRRRHIEDP